MLPASVAASMTTRPGPATVTKRRQAKWLRRPLAALDAFMTDTSRSPQDRLGQFCARDKALIRWLDVFYGGLVLNLACRDGVEMLLAKSGTHKRRGTLGGRQRSLCMIVGALRTSPITKLDKLELLQFHTE